MQKAPLNLATYATYATSTITPSEPKDGIGSGDVRKMDHSQSTRAVRFFQELNSPGPTSSQTRPLQTQSNDCGVNPLITGVDTQTSHSKEVTTADVAVVHGNPCDS